MICREIKFQDTGKCTIHCNRQLSKAGIYGATILIKALAPYCILIIKKELKGMMGTSGRGRNTRYSLRLRRKSFQPTDDTWRIEIVQRPNNISFPSTQIWRRKGWAVFFLFLPFNVRLSLTKERGQWLPAPCTSLLDSLHYNYA